MGGNFSRLKSRPTGNTISGPDDDAEFDNVINNMTPAGLDDYSLNVAQMQSTADPYPGSVESLATSGAGEFERLRFQFLNLLQGLCPTITQWYHDPIIAPKMAYVSKSSDYPLTLSDFCVEGDASAAQRTLTLPAASSSTGKVYSLRKLDASANTVVIARTGADTIDGAASNVTLSFQNEGRMLICDGSGWKTIAYPYPYKRNLANPGYIYIGPILLQFGSTACDAAGNLTVTFPVAFPTALAHVNGIGQDTGGTRLLTVLNAAPSTTQAVFYIYNEGAGAPANAKTVYWFAVGY